LKKFESISSRYKSTNHEKDAETGYDDRNARFYDDEALRFVQVDQLAESRPTLNPYNYVQNNPIGRTDPTGMLDDIYINSKTGVLSTIATNDGHDRIIIDGKFIENKPKGLAQKIWKENGLETNNLDIKFGKEAKKDKVSIFSTSVIVDAMNESNNHSIEINRTASSPEEQVDIMFSNEKNGIHIQYKQPGENVKKLYPNRKAMIDQIYKEGPSNVSNHCSNDPSINVIDISPWRNNIKNPKSLANEFSNDKRIGKTLTPWNSKDPAIHIEVLQNKK
jgi:RHS repeat-associated protein